MIYLSWAAVYEGPTEHSYFDVLLPRIMEEITRVDGTRTVTIPATPAVALSRYGRDIARVAEGVRDNAAAFHLLFIHADTGGRSVRESIGQRSTAHCQAVHELCEWNPARCVIVTSCHETEAWVMADPNAVMAALGYRGKIGDLGLPSDALQAERLVDPKVVLENAVVQIRGRRARRNGSQLFSTIAQTQDIAALRGSSSFRAFESKLRAGLVSLGCLAPPL